MGFFDKARELGKGWGAVSLSSWKSALPKSGASMKGASYEMQAAWKSLPASKKAHLRRTMKDTDGDGVPDKFDCQPLNPKEQDWNPKASLGSQIAYLKRGFYLDSQDDRRNVQKEHGYGEWTPDYRKGAFDEQRKEWQEARKRRLSQPDPSDEEIVSSL